MSITTIYEIVCVGDKWVARLGSEYFDRGQILARIKSMTQQGIDAEEEWAALAMIERKSTEDRWKKHLNKRI